MKLLKGGMSGMKDKLIVVAAAAAVLIPMQSAALKGIAAPTANQASGQNTKPGVVRSVATTGTTTARTATTAARTSIKAAPVSTVKTAAPSYAKGRAALLSKNYKEAAKHFQTAMAEDKSLMTNCECRLNLGKSLVKVAAALPKGCPEQAANYRKGASELRKAIRVGRGSRNANEANALLMALPHQYIAPKMGDDTPMIAMANGIRGLDRGLGGEMPKPKILEFYASWCEPCKQLKPLMEKVKNEYGDQVEFLSYNVDDPEVEKVVEDYEVSPIPTLIFLDQSNQVVTYSIGFSGDAGLKRGLKKIGVAPAGPKS